MRSKVLDDLLEAAGDLEGRGRGTLEGFLDVLSLRARDRGEDEGGSGVTLLTMHAAKGLEFRVVFVVGMEEGILPHRNALGSDGDAADPERAAEEERRLCYVALTRARERLVLTCARERTRFGRAEERTPSRFIDEIGRDRLHVIDGADPTPADPAVGREMMRRIRSRLGRGGRGGPPWWEQLHG